jgi:hypothetical protein
MLGTSDGNDDCLTTGNLSYFDCEINPPYWYYYNDADDGVCTSATISNCIIPSQNLENASNSLTSYMNMTINITDFDTSLYTFSDYPPACNMAQCALYVFENVTVPEAMRIIPNPLNGLNQQNITQIQSLINTAQTSLGKQYPMDILDSLSPVMVFASISDAATQIYNAGVKIEEEQREEKILAIVFGLLGLVSAFLGPVAGPISAVALDALQIWSSYALTGELTPLSIVGVIFDTFGGMFSILEETADIAKVATSLRGFSTDSDSDLTSSLSEFKHYKDIREIANGAPACPA